MYEQEQQPADMDHMAEPVQLHIVWHLDDHAFIEVPEADITDRMARTRDNAHHLQMVDAFNSGHDLVKDEDGYLASGGERIDQLPVALFFNFAMSRRKEWVRARGFLSIAEALAEGGVIADWFKAMTEEIKRLNGLVQSGDILPNDALAMLAEKYAPTK